MKKRMALPCVERSALRAESRRGDGDWTGGGGAVISKMVWERAIPRVYKGKGGIMQRSTALMRMVLIPCADSHPVRRASWFT